MHEWELLNAVVALQSHQLVTALSSLCPPQPGVCFTADPDAKCFQWKHLPTSRTVFTAHVTWPRIFPVVSPPHRLIVVCVQMHFLVIYLKIVCGVDICEFGSNCPKLPRYIIKTKVNPY